MTQTAQAIAEADWVETEEFEADVCFAKVCFVDSTVFSVCESCCSVFVRIICLYQSNRRLLM